MQLCRGCLAALTELEQVAGENLLVRRLVGRVVYANVQTARWCGSILPLSSERVPAKREQAGNKKEDFSARSARNVETPSTHRFLNDNVVANCYANEERLDTPTGRAAGSRSTKYD